MKQNSRVVSENIAVQLEKDQRTIKRNIQQLKSLGILRRLGSKKTGFWEIVIEYF
jgi:ATP-dependent DNA helicase RecG